LQDKGIVGFVENGGLHLFHVDSSSNSWCKKLKHIAYGCCTVDEDMKKVYIAISSGQLACFNIETGEVIWKQKIDKRANYFTEIYKQGTNLIVKGSYPGVLTKIFIFDSETGQLRAEIRLPKEVFLVPHNETIFAINVTKKRVEGFKPEEVLK